MKIGNKIQNEQIKLNKWHKKKEQTLQTVRSTTCDKLLKIT